MEISELEGKENTEKTIKQKLGSFTNSATNIENLYLLIRNKREKTRISSIRNKTGDMTDSTHTQKDNKQYCEQFYANIFDNIDKTDK